MEWFLFGLSVVLVVPVTVLLSTALVATSSMRRANGLVPGRNGREPPLQWLWSPSAGAVLHRRLRNACHLVAPIATMRAPRRRWRRSPQIARDAIAELAKDVLQEALVLDDQVIASSRLGHGLPRSQAVAALDIEVSGVEDAARRVHQLAVRRAQLGRMPGPAALGLDQRIAAMEDAMSELSSPPRATS